MKNTLQSAPIGHTWININSFMRKYMSVMPMDLFTDLQKIELNGTNRVALTTSTIEYLNSILEERKAQNKKLSQCASLNNKGIAYEKNNKINLAIKTYEKNIELGYPAHHSFKRLMILYRKNKDYANERCVILRALEVFPDWSEYVDRLNKIEQLICRK